MDVVDLGANPPPNVSVGDKVHVTWWYDTDDATRTSPPSSEVSQFEFGPGGGQISVTIGSQNWRVEDINAFVINDDTASPTPIDYFGISGSTNNRSDFPGASQTSTNAIAVNYSDFGGSRATMLNSSDLPVKASDFNTFKLNKDLSGVGLSSFDLGAENPEGWFIETSIKQSTTRFNPVFKPTSKVNDFGNSSLTGDISSFDKNLPTVVVTHGWQPGRTWPQGVELLEQMYSEITKQYGSQVNVVTYSWSDAYTGPAINLFNIAKPLPFVDGAGVDLGKKLSSLLGSGYSQNLHLIGHSYGSAVNLTAASELSLNGVKTTHMTVLDAPTDAPGTYGLSKSHFSLASSLPWIGYLENYYGREGGLGGAYGDKIAGAERNGGYAYNTDHAGVWMQYAQTVSSSSCSSLGGFSYSAALGGTGCFDKRPGSPTPPPVTKVDPALLNLILQQNASFDTTNSTLSISTGSDGFAILDLIIPDDADTLSFSLEFLFPGDGDWLEVALNGELIGAYKGTLLGSQKRKFYYDVSEFAGQIGELSFLLASSGDAPAKVELSGFEFYSTENISGAVPLPASSWLLIFALSATFAFARMEKSNERNTI